MARGSDKQCRCPFPLLVNELCGRVSWVLPDAVCCMAFLTNPYLNRRQIIVVEGSIRMRHAGVPRV